MEPRICKILSHWAFYKQTLISLWTSHNWAEYEASSSALMHSKINSFIHSNKCVWYSFPNTNMIKISLLDVCDLYHWELRKLSEPQTILVSLASTNDVLLVLSVSPTQAWRHLEWFSTSSTFDCLHANSFWKMHDILLVPLMFRCFGRSIQPILLVES